MRLVHSEISTTRVIRLVAIPIAPRILPERQNLSAGFHPAAILAMTRWITAPVMALDDAGFHPSATAVVLHQGCADQTRDHEAELAQLRHHSFCHAAQVRGAKRCGCRDYMIDKGRAPQPNVVAMRRDRQARAVCRVYELPATEVADLRSAYESEDHRC